MASDGLILNFWGGHRGSRNFTGGGLPAPLEPPLDTVMESPGKSRNFIIKVEWERRIRQPGRDLSWIAALFRVVGPGMYQSQTHNTYPAHPSSFYHTGYESSTSYPAPPSSAYQWPPASYQGQTPPSGYPGPPSAPVYPGQQPSRSSGVVNNDGLPQHPMNSMSLPYQHSNSNPTGDWLFLIA